MWGAPDSSTPGSIGPLSVYLSPDKWFLFGAPCTLNYSFTSTLKPALIMCSYTATDTQSEGAVTALQFLGRPPPFTSGPVPTTISTTGFLRYSAVLPACSCLQSMKRHPVTSLHTMHTREPTCCAAFCASKSNFLPAAVVTLMKNIATGNVYMQLSEVVVLRARECSTPVP